MSILPKTPLIDEDGEIANLGDAFFDNAIRCGGFGSDVEAHAFLIRRDELARIADDVGPSREAWDALSPKQPGFEARFALTMEDPTERVRAVVAE